MEDNKNVPRQQTRFYDPVTAEALKQRVQQVQRDKLPD